MCDWKTSAIDCVLQFSVSDLLLNVLCEMTTSFRKFKSLRLQKTRVTKPTSVTQNRKLWTTTVRRISTKILISELIHLCKLSLSKIVQLKIFGQNPCVLVFVSSAMPSFFVSFLSSNIEWLIGFGMQSCIVLIFSATYMAFVDVGQIRQKEPKNSQVNQRDVSGVYIKCSVYMEECEASAPSSEETKHLIYGFSSKVGIVQRPTHLLPNRISYI